MTKVLQIPRNVLSHNTGIIAGLEMVSFRVLKSFKGPVRDQDRVIEIPSPRPRPRPSKVGLKTKTGLETSNTALYTVTVKPNRDLSTVLANVK